MDNEEKIKRLQKELNYYKKMSYFKLCRTIEEDLEPEEYRYNMIKLLNYEIKELKKGDNNENLE